jgi:hypothetical protein
MTQKINLVMLAPDVPIGGGSGETNTSSNLGAGVGLAATKSGVNLPFKSLIAGTNVTLTPTGTDVTISATAGGGGVSAVTGTAPISSSGGSTPVISIGAATGSVPGSMSAADFTKLAGITGSNTGNETGATVATLLHSATAKTTLVDADEVNGTDSAASFSLIRTTWANVKVYLKAYFDTLYATIGLTQNSQSAAYTLVLSDAGKQIFHPSADTTARTWTIPANGSVAFPIGTPVTFINQNAGGVITIAITTDTLRLAGPGTTGSRTLAANGIATAVKVTATEWIINGTGLT